jgi:hypothetical protein
MRRLMQRQHPASASDYRLQTDFRMVSENQQDKVMDTACKHRCRLAFQIQEDTLMLEAA